MTYAPDICYTRDDVTLSHLVVALQTVERQLQMVDVRPKARLARLWWEMILLFDHVSG